MPLGFDNVTFHAYRCAHNLKWLSTSASAQLLDNGVSISYRAFVHFRPRNRCRSGTKTVVRGCVARAVNHHGGGWYGPI